MVSNVDGLIAELLAEVDSSLSIKHELLKAPHLPACLPEGRCAIYVFSLSQSAGDKCPAGPDRVLKVGSAGPNSNARFQSQHYYPKSSGSNLAKTLLRSTEQWKYLGISQLTDVKLWMTGNLDRDHFFLDKSQKDRLRQLERFLRARLSPVFEG